MTINAKNIQVTNPKDFSFSCPQWQPSQDLELEIKELVSILESNELLKDSVNLAAANLYNSPEESIWSFVFITPGDPETLTLIQAAIQEWGDNGFILRSRYYQNPILLITASIS